MTTRQQNTTALCFAVFLTGCSGGPRPVVRVAADIRRAIPAGWSVSNSNATIRIESQRSVTLIGRYAREPPPPTLPPDQRLKWLARTHGYTTKYQVELSFSPRLSPVELEGLREARRPFERVLDTGARSKSEHGDAMRGYDQHRVPVFYTDDYSIFVDRPTDRSIEVYPPEAGAQVQALMVSLKKVFREY